MFSLRPLRISAALCVERPINAENAEIRRGPQRKELAHSNIDVKQFGSASRDSYIPRSNIEVDSILTIRRALCRKQSVTFHKIRNAAQRIRLPSRSEVRLFPRHFLSPVQAHARSIESQLHNLDIPAQRQRISIAQCRHAAPVRS